MAEGLVTISVLRADGSTEDLGAPGEAWVETKDLDLGSRQEKHLEGLLLEIEGTEFLLDGTVQIGTCDRRGDPVVWSERQSITDLRTMLWWDLPDSRFFRIKLREGVRATKWKLSRMEFYGFPLDGML